MSRSPRLYLLRHAKSSWTQPELADHDRPLAGRGRRAAKAIARLMDEHDVAPQLVLCSTARRVRETFERIEPALGDPTVSFEPELYGATAEDLLQRLRKVPDGTASVLLIGHNPAIEQLALALARPSRLRSEMAAKFPTAALATLALSGAKWKELGPVRTEVVGFVRPRDLD
jgi:phosphohistidine phosphatase